MLSGFSKEQEGKERPHDYPQNPVYLGPESACFRVYETHPFGQFRKL